MARTACLVCLVCTVSGRCKNLLGRASISCGHKAKLEQSTFLRYLWIEHWPIPCAQLQEIVVTMATANIMAPHAIRKQKLNKNIPVA